MYRTVFAVPDDRKPTAAGGISAEAALTREIYEAYRDAANEVGWPDRALKSDQFFKGIQWEDEDIEKLKLRSEAPIVQNETERIIRGKIALMTARQPSFSVTPREDSDASMARMIAKLLEWHIETSGGNIIFDTALHHWAHRGGRGILFSWFDPNADFGKGEVFTKAIEDPLDVLPDPNSKDYLWRDAQHIVIRRILTRAQCEETWPNKKAIINKAKDYENADRPASSYSYRESDGDSISPPLVGDPYDRYHTRFEILERYTKTREQFMRVFHEGEEEIFPIKEYEAWLQGRAFVLDDGEEQKFAILGEALEESQITYVQLLKALNVKDGQAVMFHFAPMVDPQTGQGDMVTVPGPEDENGIPNSTVILSPVPRESIVDVFTSVPHSQTRIKRFTTIGDEDLDKATLPYDQYPITPIMNGWSGNPFPTDDVDRVREIQRLINFTEQKIAKHLASQAGTNIIVPQGFFAQDPSAEDKIGAPGTKVLYGNYGLLEGRDITVLSPTQMANELYLSNERRVRSMERILGYYEFQSGNVSEAHDTAAGTLALDQFAQRGVAGDLRKLQVSLSHHAGVVVQMYQRHITAEKVIRLVDPYTSKDESYRLNYEDFSSEGKRFNDITVGRYDVRAEASSMLPENTIARADYYLLLFQAGAIDQEELLKKLKEFDSSAILERTSMMQQMQQQLQQMDEKIKELEGDKQTADRELRHSDRRVAAEKFKSSLEGVKADARVDQKVARARIQDVVKGAQQGEA